MRHYRTSCTAAWVLVLLAMGSAQPAETRAQPPKMKMSTDIPASLKTPDKVETRIGTKVAMSLAVVSRNGIQGLKIGDKVTAIEK